MNTESLSSCPEAASRVAHSHQPSQWISSTRVSGWAGAAIDNHREPVQLPTRCVTPARCAARARASPS
eukprot:9114280-Pyramimonas_sp.AAC.1